MKLEDQVCTLEQSSRLKELGVRQFGNFFYTLRNGVYELRWGYETLTSEISCHAFTVAELGVMLPAAIPATNNIYSADLLCSKVNTIFKIEYNVDRITKGDYCANVKPAYDGIISSDNEAECRAAMLIHLLENGIITVKQVNEKL